VLLHAHLLEKAVYEVAYELNNRLAWLKSPFYGILHLIEAEKIQTMRIPEIFQFIVKH